MTLRVKALAWFGLTGALFFTGALMIGGGIAGAVALHRIQYETATTVGTLTKTGICGKATTDGTATFTVAGTTYNARAECNARVGDPVPVKYDPTDRLTITTATATAASGSRVRSLVSLCF